jgi:hypothetical protein
MTSPRTISYCQLPGRSSSKLREKRLSRIDSHAGRRIDQRLGIGVNTPEPILLTHLKLESGRIPGNDAAFFACP